MAFCELHFFSNALQKQTGCNVIAVSDDGRLEINPDASRPLPPRAELILVGDAESEGRFLARYPSA